MSLQVGNPLKSDQLKMQLHTQLVEHISKTKEEESHLTRIIELVTQNSYDDITEKTRGDHHLTASAIITSKLGVLLHFHKRVKMWLQPGGHIDLGETPLITVQRETFEETGLIPIFDSRIFDLDIHDTGYGHIHYDIRYLAWCDDTNFNPPSEESQKVAWFSYSAAEQVVDGGLLRVMKKLNAKIV